jgi:hypothetical protein
MPLRKTIAKEEEKSFHIHLLHFICYFIVSLMLNPISNGPGRRARDISV